MSWVDSARIRSNPAGTAVLLAAVVLLFLFSIVPAQEAPVPKRILVVYWYNRDYANDQMFAEAFQTALRSAPAGTVEYYSEYLESDRFPGENQSLLLRDYLRKKYADLPIDVVVAAADAPLEFLLNYRNDLFPNTPIVFGAVRRPSSRDLAAEPGMTGLVYGYDLKNTLDSALSLHPGLEEVFIISGTLEADKRLEIRAREQLQGYEGRVRITYLTDFRPDELALRTKSLPERSIVIYVWQQTRNQEGKVVESSEVLPLIVNSSPVPIYGLASWQVGQGIVGGYVRINEATGARVAQISLRIAQGERAQDIPVETATTMPMFDWRALQRWRISEELLPPGSVVRFRAPSFWDQYKWSAIAVLSVVLLQSALIVGLVINRSRRRRAEAERAQFASLADTERRRLDEVISNVPGVVWESVFEANGTTRQAVFVNQYAEKMLGYSLNDWLSTPNFAQVIAHEDDREKIARGTAAVVESKKNGVFQFRWLAKDGRQLWVEAHLAVVRNETGDVIGVRGITMDITDRKLADESLYRSEAKNRAILRALPDLMFIQTLDGVFLDYHANDLSNLAATPEEFLGKNMSEVLPPKLAEDFLTCFNRAQATGEPQSLEYSLPMNGEERWYEARIVSTQGDKILSIVRDITDAKLAESDRIENEAKLAGIVGSAMDAIISIDQDQRIVLFNNAAEKMFGCSEREALGTSISRFIPQRFREAHLQHVTDFGESTETKRAMGATGSFYACRVNGEEFPIEASISQLELHGQKFYTVVLRDITKRRHAMDALRESEERFRHMADTAPVMIWVSDIDKRCTYVNEQLLEFTGRTMEEQLGNGWADGVHPEDQERCLETYGNSFDQREPFTMEYRLRRADGEYRWVLASGAPRFSASGEFLGYIGSCIDISERKAAEETLEGLSGQLIRAREEECARIARELHDDLNQRLALISIDLEQLGQSTLNHDGKSRSQLQAILKQTFEVSREIHRISYDLHPSKLTQLGLVAALKSLCEDLWVSHELKVEFIYEDVPVGLPQDISLCLYRIAQEGLTNIVKHSGAEEATVALRGTEKDIRLCVSDSGAGFDIESPTLKKGLGLVSMRERLRLVGGTVSIESSPSRGTQIDARVPLSRIGLEHNPVSPVSKTRAAKGD